MILILGGTTEGRDLAGYLSDAGFKIVLSAATGFPGRDGTEAPARINGSFDQGGLIGLIEERRVRAVVDATHPFALRISGLARSVCAGLDLPYLRYERAFTDIPDHPDISGAATPADALAKAAAWGGNLFLATGVKSIKSFASGVPRERLFARILPWPSSIDEALKWLPPENVIAALGPFSREFNKACFDLFDARTLVTKNSGAGSGLEEKISAALKRHMKVVIIERPPAPEGSFTGFAEVADRLKDDADGV